MSQQQRPQPTQPTTEPRKFDDVFSVSSKLASKPIVPQDAATMQSAENTALGNTQKSCPVAVMNSAATKNKRVGLVNHDQGFKMTRQGRWCWMRRQIGVMLICIDGLALLTDGNIMEVGMCHSAFCTRLGWLVATLPCKDNCYS